MSRLGKFTVEKKLQIIQEYVDQHGKLAGICRKYNIDVKTLKDWTRKFQLYGTDGLEIRKSNSSYSETFKLNAVQDYLTGHFSLCEVIRKYHIASTFQLRSWISKYNSHSTLKSSHGGQIAMTKGRTTTYQERIDIVNFCVANQRDYRKTMEQFQVSYQQVYQWVQKFEKGGVDALQDRRGHNKRIEELNDADAQKLAMKKLEYENERLRVENMYLKKLQEFQRRGK